MTSVAAIAALVFTSQSVQGTCDQLAIFELGQVTERFGRAVDQLGSDKLDVRLGSIYVLEQLMRDAPERQTSVVEVRARSSRPSELRMHRVGHAHHSVLGWVTLSLLIVRSHKPMGPSGGLSRSAAA